MKLTDFFREQIEAEAPRTARVLERIPEGRDDWKPHDKSMPMGRLTTLVAGMPEWLEMMIRQDSLDLSPPGGSTYRPPSVTTRDERLSAHNAAVAKARAALAETTDEHLAKPWRLLVAGKVVSEQPRHVVLRDTFMHLAHHRAQLTGYLRLLDVAVPAVYGPSADESRFD
jgi:uncharacterized damage-inducible protein DinB